MIDRKTPCRDSRVWMWQDRDPNENGQPMGQLVVHLFFPGIAMALAPRMDGSKYGALDTGRSKFIFNTP